MEPATRYTPEFKKEQCPKTVKASVLLCDRNSGCLLDEAETILVISFDEGKPKITVSPKQVEGPPGTTFDFKAMVNPIDTYRFEWEIGGLGEVFSQIGENSGMTPTVDKAGEYPVTVKIFNMDDEFLCEDNAVIQVTATDLDTEDVDRVEENTPPAPSGYWVLYDKKPIDGCQFYESDCWPLQSCTGGEGSYQISVGSSTCGSNASGKSGSGTYSVPPARLIPGEMLVFKITASGSGYTSIHVSYYQDKDKMSFDEKGYNTGISSNWNKKIVGCNSDKSPSKADFQVPEGLEKGGALLIDGGGSIGTSDTSRHYFYLYKWRN